MLQLSLIDMKKQYPKNDKAFVNATLHNSNNMQLACILGAY